LSPEFSANNLTIADYAVINLGAPNGSGGFNNVQETAALVVNGLTPVAPSTTAPGLNVGLVTIPGATPYKLYFMVTSTSSLSPDAMGGLSGQFSTLTYQLIGDQGGNCTFVAAGSSVTPSCAGDAQYLLATGSLNNSLGDNAAHIDDGTPAANVAANIVAGANAGGFFVSPSDLTTIDFESAFTNTSGAITTTPTGFLINGGGGNIDIVVPEPLTLSLFGAGLLGAGALRRRRSKKA
jgi:hypothetical protein